MKSPSAKVAVVDPETEDTDPVQRPSVHSVAMVTAVAELGLCRQVFLDRVKPGGAARRGRQGRRNVLRNDKEWSGRPDRRGGG